MVASTYHAAYCDSTLPHIRAYHKHSSTWKPEPIDSTSPTRSQAVPGGLTDTMKVCVCVGYVRVCITCADHFYLMVQTKWQKQQVPFDMYATSTRTAFTPKELTEAREKVCSQESSLVV